MKSLTLTLGALALMVVAANAQGEKKAPIASAKTFQVAKAKTAIVRSTKPTSAKAAVKKANCPPCSKCPKLKCPPCEDCP